MNFKLFAILIAFVLAACVASPIEKPQQEEIGKNLKEKLKTHLLLKFSLELVFHFVQILPLKNFLRVTSLDPMPFAPFIA